MLKETDITKLNLWETFFRPIWIIARYNIIHTLSNPRNRKTALLLILPVIGAAAINVISELGLNVEKTNFQYFRIFFEFGFLYLFVPLSALSLANSVLSEEIEGKTLPYLLIRPIDKNAIVTGKHLGFFTGVVILVNLSLILTYLAFFVPESISKCWNYQGYLWKDVVIVALGLWSYGSLFLLLSQITRRSMFIGLVFIFGWEKIVSYVPGTVHKLTVLHYLQSIMPIPPKTAEKMFQIVHEPASTLAALSVLILSGLFFLFGALVLFRVKEFNPEKLSKA